jgi:LytR cell envelope-related transcriptional attenuator
MPSIVAVASVAVIVIAMVAFFAGGSGDEPRPEPQAQNAPRTAEEATPAAEPAGKKADPNADNADNADRKAKKREDRRRDRRNRPRTEPRDAPDPEAPDVYVEVYNNTTITGLAASTAAQLQDGGWQVVGVDNWRGDIPSSTVYYPAGMEDEADQLADTLGFDRVRGAVAPMKFDRLTVILTPDAA